MVCDLYMGDTEFVNLLHKPYLPCLFVNTLGILPITKFKI